MTKKERAQKRLIAKQGRLLARLSRETGLSGALLYYAIKFGIKF